MQDGGNAKRGGHCRRTEVRPGDICLSVPCKTNAQIRVQNWGAMAQRKEDGAHAHASACESASEGSTPTHQSTTRWQPSREGKLLLVVKAGRKGTRGKILQSRARSQWHTHTP